MEFLLTTTESEPKPTVTVGEARALVPFVNRELLAVGEILQNDAAMVFPQQPDQAKETQNESEHDARFFLLTS